MKEHQTGSLSNSKLMTILSPSLSSCQERSSHGGVTFFPKKGSRRRNTRAGLWLEAQEWSACRCSQKWSWALGHFVVEAWKCAELVWEEGARKACCRAGSASHHWDSHPPYGHSSVHVLVWLTFRMSLQIILCSARFCFTQQGWVHRVDAIEDKALEGHLIGLEC